MSTVPARAEPPPPTFVEALQQFGRWCRREPLQAGLLAVCLAVLVYFFGFYPAFTQHLKPLAVWTWEGWNEENDLEHGWFILPGALFIAWFHRREILAAPKSVSWLGLGVVGWGVLVFVLSVWMRQPRLGLLALPGLIYGSVCFLWGGAVARKILFPCVFLLFMIPAGFLVSRTVGLQTLTASVAAKLASIIGVGVQADGARLFAADGSFNFEVAGGCSGIRSLTAMTMLAALYVHFTQRRLWRKALIFASSLLFALAGNLVRIFTVVLVAKWGNPELAAGVYHDYSGFIFFPIAVGAMIGFGNLLSKDWRAWAMEELPSGSPSASPAARTRTTPAAGASGAGPVSYDY